MNNLIKIFSLHFRSIITKTCMNYSKANHEEKGIVRVSVKEVREFIKRVMESAGYCEENANSLATVLSLADYRGVYHLGMNLLDKYYADAKLGLCNGQAQPVLLKETCTTAYFDGNNAPGPTVADCVMVAAIKKAKCVGLGITSAFNTHSFGMGSKYVMDAVKEKCIAFAFGNSFPTIMPSGTKQVAVGSNSLAVGSPGKASGDSFILNMFASNVPLGKIELYNRKGLQLPEEWALTENGKPEINPTNVLKKPILVPLGGDYTQQGYKGYGFALAIEMLTGVLAGGAVGTEHKSYNESNKNPNLSCTFFVINPEFFADGFADRMQEMIDYLRAMEPIDPKKPVQVAGDIERKHMAEVDEKGGVPYHESQIKICSKLAADSGVKPLVTLNKDC